LRVKCQEETEQDPKARGLVQEGEEDRAEVKVVDLGPVPLASANALLAEKKWPIRWEPRVMKLNVLNVAPP
jgi:hypothetical protein